MDKKTFARLLKDAEPAVQREFIEAIQRAATGIRLKDVEAAIAANDDAALISLFALDRGDFARYERALFDAFAAAGDAAMTSHMALAAGQGANIGRVVFDASNPVATAWLRERSSLLITEIQNETVENVEALLSSIRRTLEPGIRAGQSVHTTALDLVGRVNRSTGLREGGILGLTPDEVEYAENVYADLVSGEKPRMRSYLRKNPRASKFDALVEAAIEEGRGLTPSQAAELTRHYRSGLLKVRGERIARTETIAAMNSARDDSLRQLTERGIVGDQDITRVWDASEDVDTRNSHSAMDEQPQPFGQPFVSGLGNLLKYPGDRSLGAPAEDVINCFAPWTRIGLVGLEGAVASAYCGDLVEIVVGDGVNLAVTPNHPVLTERGWVAAGEVVEGDQLIKSLRADLGGATAEPHVSDWYASAEQVYEASKRLGRVRRAGRGVVNLHGHVPGHDVDVIALPRKLRGALDAMTCEVFGNIGLAETNVSEGGASLFCGLALAHSSAAAGSHGAMRRFRSGSAFIFGHHRCGPAVAFRNARALKAHIGKAGIHCPAPDAKSGCNAENGFPGIKQSFDVWRNLGSPLPEHFGAFVRSALRVIASGVRRQSEVFVARLHDGRANANFAGYIGNQGTLAMQPADGFKVFSARRGEPFGGSVASPDGDACIDQNLVRSRVLHPLSPRDLGDTDSGGVEVNDTGIPLFAGVHVKAVSRRHYEGPVYDFQTSTGILLAEGIIVHNCRCFVHDKIDFIGAEIRRNR